MKTALCCSLLLCFAASALKAQQATASTNGVKPGDAAVPVTLGQSVVALTGSWKFHIGDDPRWADPGFDDSDWQPYELMPGRSPLTPEEVTQSGELPGWQQHGHPGYTGYAWYRIRLRLPGNVHSALLMPRYVDDAYEVFVNGTKIGSFGELNGWHLIYAGKPELFPIPAATPDSRQSVTLALRFWNLREEASPSEHNLPGGLRGVPVIGSSAPLRVLEQSVREQMWQAQWEARLVMRVASLYIAVGFISLFLFLFSRGQKEYLWAGVSLTGFGAMLAAIIYSQQGTISYQVSIAAQTAALVPADFAIPLAAMYLLNVPRLLWRRVNYVTSGLNLAWSLQLVGHSLGLLPLTTVAARLTGVTLGVAVPLHACFLLAIAIDGVRTIGRKAWLPMAPGLLFGIYGFLFALFSFGILKSLYWFPMFICVCVPLTVLIIFLMRFTEQQRENGRLLEDMRQAREVQQFLIPEKMSKLSGWIIESEYRPAREVGGDFFQIIPDEHDCNLLIVAGDVTGKGLQAGMLVAMLVGAIRTESAHTSDPVEILGALNSRLHGREHAQATCLAIRIAADGQALLANAGHLPPYLNGEPIGMEGALPLGMIESAQPSVMEFQLKPNDRLVLVSDGIVEATNTNGALFGFERLQALLRSAKSAGEVAAAAQTFGQEDDISIIAVTHTGIPQLASA